MKVPVAPRAYPLTDSNHPIPMLPTTSRRHFIFSGTAAGLGLLAGSQRVRAVSPNGKLRVLSIGVIGTIGGADRSNVASHPQAEIVGLCDVDSEPLARAAQDHPGAFTCRDYREAFEKHGDKFDAVIVATPDHMHAPIMLTALAHGKHVYGQKPLVNTLAELNMIESAVKAKPQLATLLGNQRMANIQRRLSVAVLKSGVLGKIRSIHAWSDAGQDGFFFHKDPEYRENPRIPENLDWNLWLGANPEHPYCDNLAPRQWRGWWDFGTGGLGDWGCHLLDIAFVVYPELVSPYSVKSECPEPPRGHFHAPKVSTVMKHKVNSPAFASDTVEIHYYHPDLHPAPEELGLEAWPGGANKTAFVGENGTLVVEAEGHSKLYRGGKEENALRLEGLPKLEPFNHWHSWVDKALGKKVKLITPFEIATRITEATILGGKASRFLGRELLWDRSKLSFDLREANGFAPPRI